MIMHIGCWALACYIGCPDIPPPPGVAAMSSLHCFFPLGERCPAPNSQLPGPQSRGGAETAGLSSPPPPLEPPNPSSCAKLFVFLKLPSLGRRSDPGMSCSQVWGLQLSGCALVSVAGQLGGHQTGSGTLQSTHPEPVCLLHGQLLFLT